MQDAPKHCVAFIDNADRGEAVRAILAGAGFDQAAVDVLSVDEMAHARSLKADVILVAVEAPHASLMASLRAKSPHCVLLVAVADPGVEVEAALEGAGADHIFDATHLSSGEFRRALALASRLRATTEELDERTTRTEDWMAATSDWFWELGSDMRFTHMSGRISEMTGLDAQSVLGRDFFSPSMMDERAQGTQEGFSSEAVKDVVDNPRSFEYAIYPSMDRHGKKHWLRVSGWPIFDDQGAFRGYRSTSIDITDEVRAQKTAEASLSLLQDALDSMPQALALFDRDDRLTLYNKQFVRECGGDEAFLHAEWRLMISSDNA
jgi:two-component system, cell cycle sensor histidine kinase and response regulator CckA